VSRHLTTSRADTMKQVAAMISRLEGREFVIAVSRLDGGKVYHDVLVTHGFHVGDLDAVEQFIKDDFSDRISRASNKHTP